MAKSYQKKAKKPRTVRITLTLPRRYVQFLQAEVLYMGLPHWPVNGSKGIVARRLIAEIDHSSLQDDFFQDLVDYGGLDLSAWADDAEREKNYGRPFATL